MAGRIVEKSFAGLLPTGAGKTALDGPITRPLKAEREGDKRRPENKGPCPVVKSRHGGGDHKQDDRDSKGSQPQHDQIGSMRAAVP
jgi:hypothetical protein